jgi:hypothetical protein
MTALASELKHLNDRPAWTCRACALPWPCAGARAHLLDEFRGYPSLLALYMSAQMAEAMYDAEAQGEAVHNDLYARFILWIRSPATATVADSDDRRKRSRARTIRQRRRRR